MKCAVRRVLLFRDSYSVTIRSYATRSTPKSKSKSNSLSLIPFQPKLANAVNIIGQIQSPLQFQTSPDGNSWAAAVIARQQSPSSPYLSIPVIFEGDLAVTAKSHLKQYDFIHVAGQLSTDPPHLDQTNIQVMVQTLNFVKGFPQLNNSSPTSTNKSSEELDVYPSKKHIRANQSEEPHIDKSWNDLLDHPTQWWDLRSTKENPEGAAFERKTTGELLFINSSTPKWLQEKLESLTIDLKPEPKQSISNEKKTPDNSWSSWRDLQTYPTQWCDFRESKLNGLVHPKHPDFKRKDGSVSLWLTKATAWVSPQLIGLEFDVPNVKSAKKAKDGKGGGESWNDLVQNSTNWWDNRLDKRNEKAPDFKHKETGEGLWLSASPSWVLPKLKGLKFHVPVVKSAKKSKDGKGDESWNDLVQNLDKWWDNRINKRNVKAPDFKHKETGEVLWLNDSPSWVLEKLPPVKTKQQSVETGRKQTLVS